MPTRKVHSPSRSDAPRPASRARRIVTRLLRAYPDPKIALHYSNALQLIIATIL